MSNTSCDNIDETQVPAKKLKQARLVFQPLKPPSAKKDNTSNAPKRKFNEIDDGIEILEVIDKDDSKENKKAVENGTAEPQETVLKKKKISVSDEELNKSKDDKIESDLKEKESVSSVVKENSAKAATAEEKGNVALVVDLEEKDRVEEDTKYACKEEEMLDQISKKLSAKGEADVSISSMADKTDGCESKSGASTEDEMEVSCIDLEEKSSESAKEPSVVDPQEESNEEDKKSKDGSVTSEVSENQSLNVSTSSAKEISVTSVKTPTSEKKTPKSRKLTPKQLEKQQEREKLRLEKERKKAEELEAKLKLKREKEELKRKEQEEKEKIRKEKEELKRREQEEKKRHEEQKRKDKEEKEKKRLAEIELKNEEKLRKEEEKRKAEEEKKKQEELKQKKENKVKAAFASFFVNKPKTEQSSKMETESEAAPTNLAFMPFQEKPFMKLAPTTRVTLSAERLASLESAITNASELDLKELYIHQLKSSDYQKGTSGKTWPSNDDDDSIIVEDDDDVEAETDIVSKRTLMRAKLLQFHENHRPPYYGTWRKKSKTIKPRNPCQKDDVHFDYEVDSDDEWEEGEGESLRGSDDEKESEDDYEVDNETFVPHGYLSDEEVQEEEDAEDMNPEAQKLKLKLLGEEFEAELSEKTERLKPILVGPMWINNNVEDTTCVDSRIVKYLMPRRAVWKENGSISTTEPFGADENSPDKENNPTSGKNRKFTDEEVKGLIRLIHGSVRNRKFLVNEFLKILESQSSSATLKNINAKMKEIATYQICPNNENAKLFGRKCWFVAPEIRAQYGLSELLASDNPHVASVPDSSPMATPDPTVAITKFTKVLSEEERLKQLSEISTEHKQLNSPQIISTASPAPTGVPLITKFTKVLSEEECQRQLTSPAAEKLPKSHDKISKSPSIKSFLTSPKPGSSTATASSPVSSKLSQPAPKEKKRLPLLASVKVGEEIPAAVRPSCASLAKPPDTPKQPEKKLTSEPMHIDPVEASPLPLNSVPPSSKGSVGAGKNSSIPSSSGVKKRVPLLVSVKRGETIPLSARPSAANCLSNEKEMKDSSKANSSDAGSSKPNVIPCVELE